jgi:small-conductance mechanosensitive channel
MKIFDLVGPNNALSIFGVKLVGFTLENGRKLLLTLLLFLFIIFLIKLLKLISHRIARNLNDVRTLFWSNQAINILFLLFFIIGFLSIWFDDPMRLTTAIGLVSAGLAFALQRVITAVAGYIIILRGKLFNVGDRISIGGVRGDVLRLNFTYTTVMEMGQPHSVQMADPAMWVEARQYTGRIVTITNDKIFDTPVYNYSREFPYIWEELHLMVSYENDLKLAEEIILNAANEHALRIAELSSNALKELERKYFVKAQQLSPRVYFRITDNWLEMTVQFITETHNIRDIKDKISRQIVSKFHLAGIKIASTTIDIINLPEIRLKGISNR